MIKLHVKTLAIMLAITLLLTGCVMSPEVLDSNMEPDIEESIATEDVSENEREVLSEVAGTLTEADVAKIDAIIQKQDYTDLIGFSGLYDFL